MWGDYIKMVETTTSYNDLRIKKVAEGNLGEGAKHHSLLSAVRHIRLK